MEVKNSLQFLRSYSFRFIIKSPNTKTIFYKKHMKPKKKQNKNKVIESIKTDVLRENHRNQ